MITTTLTWIAKSLLVLASILAFALSFLVVADVIGRSVFSAPVQGTPELVSSSIVIICYLMAVYAILSGGMMEVTLVTDNVPPVIRAILGVIACLLGAALFGLIGWGSIDRFVHSWVANSFEGEGALRVPTWPPRLAVLVGSWLATLAYLLLAVRGVQATLRGEPFSTGVSH
jgi:TRAP-type C4-dicarboxylate transport system permease small subunit